MRAPRFLALLLVLWLTACAVQPTPAPPTLTPIVVTATPLPPTATPLPTRAPLPTPVALAATPVVDVAAPQGRLRLVHAAPSLGNSVDAALDALVVVSQLTLFQASPTAEVAAGDYTLRLLPGGSPPDAEAVADVAVTLTADETLTVVLTDGPNGVTATPIPAVRTPLAADQARVQLANLLTSGNDLTVTVDGQMLSASPGTVGEAQTVPVVTAERVGAGLPNEPLALTARTLTLVLALPNPAGDPQSLVLTELMPGRATLQTVNLTDVPALDLYLNDAPLLTALAFGQPSERLPLAEGGYVLTAFPAGANPAEAEPVLSAPLQLLAAQDTTAVLAGTAAALRLVQVPVDLTPTNPNEARVLLVNVNPEVPVLQAENYSIYEIENPVVTFGAAPLVLTFPAGIQRAFNWRGGPEGEPVYFEDTELVFDEGGAYLYVLNGDDAPLVFSENVGTLQNPANAVEAQLVAVNAWLAGEPVQLVVDAAPAGDPLAYGEATAPQTVGVGQHTYAFVGGADNRPLVTGQTFVQAGEPLTLVLHELGGRLVVTELPPFLEDTEADPELTPTNARVRLVNLRPSGQTDLDLAYIFVPQLPEIYLYTAVTPEAEPQPTVTRAPDAVFEEILPRIPLPADITAQEAWVQAGNIGPVLPITAGVRDVLALDVATNTVYGALPGVELVAGETYTVLVQASPQHPFSALLLLAQP